MEWLLPIDIALTGGLFTMFVIGALIAGKSTEQAKQQVQDIKKSNGYNMAFLILGIIGTIIAALQLWKEYHH